MKLVSATWSRFVKRNTRLSLHEFTLTICGIYNLWLLEERQSLAVGGNSLGVRVHGLGFHDLEAHKSGKWPQWASSMLTNTHDIYNPWNLLPWMGDQVVHLPLYSPELQEECSQFISSFTRPPSFQLPHSTWQSQLLMSSKLIFRAGLKELEYSGWASWSWPVCF